jgi:hypothetical protein
MDRSNISRKNGRRHCQRGRGILYTHAALRLGTVRRIAYQSAMVRHMYDYDRRYLRQFVHGIDLRTLCFPIAARLPDQSQ